MSNDSTADTLDHIEKVQARIHEIRAQLALRGVRHDRSKLEPPEKAGFDVLTFKLASLTYGSDEYRAALKEGKPTIDHHYAVNSHHPEHWPIPEIELLAELRDDILTFRKTDAFDADLNQRIVGWLEHFLVELESRINGMSLLDIVEMLCDWKAASERTKQGSIAASLVHNKQRFGISDQLFAILENTVRELDW